MQLARGWHRWLHGCASLRAVVICFISAVWLPDLCRADTYDIGINLFDDPNCMNWVDQLVILDGGCYANRWAPNATKGFKINIVDFNNPQKMHMREYSDDCHTQSWEAKTFTSGTDPCALFLGSTWARFDIRFRSNTCKGQLCSNLAIAVQTFYSAAFCAGPAHSIFRYPVQGECMRAFNGTQDLTAGGGDANISLMDYGGSDNCKAGRGIRFRTYSITNRFCYPLYSNRAPRSFSWRVERTTPYAAASDGSRSLPQLLAIVVFLMGLREMGLSNVPNKAIDL